MGQLAKTFGIRSRRSFANIANTPLSVRTNVLGGMTGTAGNGGIIHIPNRTLANYVVTMNQCKSYECFDLVQNIMKLLTDYVNSQLDLQNKEFVEILDDKTLTERVIKLIKEVDYNNKFISAIFDIIYYGGKGFKISKTKINNLYNLSLIDILEPYKIVKILEYKIPEKPYNRFIPKHIVYKYNVLQHQSSIEVQNEELLFMGNQDFKLIDANQAQSNSLINEVETDKLLLDEYSVYASKPLFFSVLDDLKNYIVYKTLSNVLAVKDVLIPNFMRLGVDLTKATSTDMINATVNELESKINESIDTTLVMGQNLQIDQLINAVFSTVRVLPDPGNLLSSVDALNLDPLKEKLDNINSKLEETRNSIFESLGIPPDLFEGGSNQYEVTTRNERYKTCISSILSTLKKAYKDNLIKLYKIKYPKCTNAELTKLGDMTIKLFRVSSIELEKDKNIIEQNKDLVESMDQLTSTFNSLMNNNLIKKDETLNALKSIMGNLGTKYKSIIVDEVPKEAGSEDSGGWQ